MTTANQTNTSTGSESSNAKVFKAGETYTVKSICDQDCIFSITVEKRTAKTVTTSNGKTLRIFILDNIEKVKPLGSYSMAPTISAR